MNPTESTAIYVGTAGWSLRKEVAAEFGSEGSHLQRFASQLNAVEINSSFYRPHRRSTYERWAASTPMNFKFSVKIPKKLTHEKRLVDCEVELQAFIDQVSGLGEKLGPLLVQLPPSLSWSESPAEAFFSGLRAVHSGSVVCEPRHVSWFDDQPTRQLRNFAVGRVAADPAVVSAAALPEGDLATCYFRWHGSPRVYYSSYDGSKLRTLADQLLALKSSSAEVWCIFDNTAENAAIQNALELTRLVSGIDGLASTTLRLKMQ